MKHDETIMLGIVKETLMGNPICFQGAFLLVRGEKVEKTEKMPFTGNEIGGVCRH